MDFGGYTDACVLLAVDLVNSEPLAGDPDDLADVEQLRAFVAEHLPSWDGPVTQTDLTAIREMRGVLRQAFLAQSASDAAALLNGLLDRVGSQFRLDDHDGRWHLHVVAAQPGVAAALIAIAATGMAMVVADHGVSRFGVCASETCIDSFVDHTKNRSRRYCCEGCANVSAVRKHRARSSSPAS